jgi:acetyl-CoA carboxylase biotin carboxyl carrier protein
MPGKKQPRKSAEGAWGVDIENLIDLLVDRQITEFEMEKGGFRIRIKRGETPSAMVTAPPAPVQSIPVTMEPAPVTLPSVEPAHSSAVAPADTVADSTEGLHIIKSPIVGTFYAAPSPNSPPFVKLGDVVQVGQVLCIVEAMKLMNEIESEAAGELVRIYVESGQPVEYGQSLFAIKPHHKK